MHLFFYVLFCALSGQEKIEFAVVFLAGSYYFFFVFF